MASQEESGNILISLQKQLSTARDEISNLRKEIKTLKFAHSKEVEVINSSLKNWTCPSCQSSSNGTEEPTGASNNRDFMSDTNGDSIRLQPIGTISTAFCRKRAIPRQPTMNMSSQGKVSLHNYVFTNPEHSLEGLEGFSHMWIMFYFHKNESNHIRAKVAPPRLNGARVGVFGTRSPHRPCPIGLSLVQIDKIEGSSVYFSGVDMLDGTPVLDLKPYIPHYDDPAQLCLEPDWERQALDGEEGESSSSPVVTPALSRPSPAPASREAPDGEEEQLEASPSLTHSRSPMSAQRRQVRIPEWLSQAPVSPLQVVFAPQVQSLLTSLESDQNLTRVITDILCEDPRSVYLRDRYANQFYTFQIQNYHVSCKFDDNSHTVRVFRVVSAGSVCECGQPEWQCSIHSSSTDS